MICRPAVIISRVNVTMWLLELENRIWALDLDLDRRCLSGL
jgi:hypothetical protein